MDDFGNQLHWTDMTRGWHSMGLYGYAEGYALDILAQSVDFDDLR